VILSNNMWGTEPDRVEIETSRLNRTDDGRNFALTERSYVPAIFSRMNFLRAQY
jgi:hypothetical protein